MCAQAVALGAAVQAGVLEGSVDSVMVMDIWQASLMRALATRQLEDEAAAAHDAATEGPAEGLLDDPEEACSQEEDASEVSWDTEVIDTALRTLSCPATWHKPVQNWFCKSAKPCTHLNKR